MIVLINNPVAATNIFLGIFIIFLALSMKRKTEFGLFSIPLTQSLKGLAILAVVFSHIGYFLVDDSRFLFPVSVMAGVGVNLFLFLSGYGLVTSAVNKKYSVWQFYLRRLPRLFVPFWITLAVFFLLDFFVLKNVYSADYIIRSFLGFFPRADLYSDINSPLWYFTLILFYYLLFPLLFSKKYPWILSLFLYLAGYFILSQDFPLIRPVRGLYETHFIAFPLGALVGSLFYKPHLFGGYFSGKIIRYWSSVTSNLSLNRILEWIKKYSPLVGLVQFLRILSYYAIIAILLYVISYTIQFSNIGKSFFVEQITSLITMAFIIILFLFKRIEFKLLTIFGLYSYEIYLLHWPILYYYDYFFKYFPAWLAVILYLALFLALGYGLKKLSRKILRA